MKRLTLLISTCIVLVCGCLVAWGLYFDSRLERGFNEIKQGDSESAVVQRIGNPERVERCGDFMGPLSKAELEVCAREYLYASPFSPLVPQYYVVRFDPHGRVSSTTPYSSP